MNASLDPEIAFYNDLHQSWKTINEQSQLSQVYDLTQTFVTRLGYQRCLIFTQDDKTGLFRIKTHCGYEDPKQLKLLNIVTLLLSGEIIEHLRVSNDMLIHTQQKPQELVTKFLQPLGLKEAALSLFAGNDRVPFGLIVVGNHQDPYQSPIDHELMQISLKNIISNLSYSTNNILFYQSWHKERLFLRENIEERTKELKEQKETFEAIYNSSRIGICLIDVHTSAFLEANPAYLEITRFTKAELLRTGCIAITIEEDKNRLKRALQDAIDHGFVKDFINTCVVKDGVRIIVGMTFSLMSDGQRVLVTARDITEKHRLERELVEARNLAEEVHRQTIDSIEYASLIQGAMMPEPSFFQRFFRDSFCIWLPKNIVGGDIYSLVKLRHEDEALLMVIDCTGHGVPGAFVTMLVKAIEQQVLSKLMQSHDEVSPADILSIFNKELKRLLKQDIDEGVHNAGFDGGILYYNKQQNIIRYAGARTPLFYSNPLDNNTLAMINGDRHSVGYKRSRMDYVFQEHQITLQEGMSFYITTDGYLDQNGGDKDFPLGRTLFMQTIEQHQHKSLSDQKMALLNLLSEYQQDRNRNDDITVIGLQF